MIALGMLLLRRIGLVYYGRWCCIGGCWLPLLLLMGGGCHIVQLSSSSTYRSQALVALLPWTSQRSSAPCAAPAAAGGTFVATFSRFLPLGLPDEALAAAAAALLGVEAAAVVWAGRLRLPDGSPAAGGCLPGSRRQCKRRSQQHSDEQQRRSQSACMAADVEACPCNSCLHDGRALPSVQLSATPHSPVCCSCCRVTAGCCCC